MILRIRVISFDGNEIGNRIEGTEASNTDSLFSLDLGHLLDLEPLEMVIHFNVSFNYAMFVVDTKKIEEKGAREAHTSDHRVVVCSMENFSFAVIASFSIPIYTMHKDNLLLGMEKEIFLCSHVSMKFDIDMLLNNMGPASLMGYSTNKGFYVVKADMVTKQKKSIYPSKQASMSVGAGTGKKSDTAYKNIVQNDYSASSEMKDLLKCTSDTFSLVIGELQKNAPRVVANLLVESFQYLDERFNEFKSSGQEKGLTKVYSLTADLSHLLHVASHKGVNAKCTYSGHDSDSDDTMNSEGVGVHISSVNENQMVLVLGDSSLLIDRICSVSKMIHYLVVIRAITTDALGDSSMMELRSELLTSGINTMGIDRMYSV